ncbi:hypothetical protein [Kitasatospora cathayae]|uniref:DUF1963 domain-containing protein n=1 Tax=Kitasatospora cathayae TaxID=3004092 RepID=A0ABY7Q9R8_9ACTN|nr:hypothetical protein [Kitasatospora sp. HUAS 3-15]WBP89412.1 hypothetical protein O1G21_28640 [Kitasatospora sp. HUAS 3-15]
MVQMPDPIAAVRRLFPPEPGEIHRYAGDLVVPEESGDTLWVDVPYGEGEGQVIEEPVASRFPVVVTLTPSEQGLPASAATVLFRDLPERFHPGGASAGLLPGIGMMYLTWGDPSEQAAEPMLLTALPELRRRGASREDNLGWYRPQFEELIARTPVVDDEPAYREGWFEHVTDPATGANAIGFLTGERSAGSVRFTDDEGRILAAGVVLDG